MLEGENELGSDSFESIIETNADGEASDSAAIDAALGIEPAGEEIKADDPAPALEGENNSAAIVPEEEKQGLPDGEADNKDDDDAAAVEPDKSAEENIVPEEKPVEEISPADPQTTEELEQYRKFGTPEEIANSLKLQDDLFGFTELNGHLAPRTGEFAQNLLKDHPEKAVELINHLVAAPSPLDADKTIFEQLLETPEVDAYLRDKYTAPVDPNLEVVPAEFRAAYEKLAPEFKQDFQHRSEAERGALLAGAQKEVLREQAENAQKEAERAEAEQKFVEAIETTTMASFDSVSGQFKESLKSIPFSPDAGMNEFLQSTVYDKIMTVVTMPDTYGGRAAAADLQKFGVSIPDDVAKLVTKLETDSRLFTQANWQKNQKAIDHYKNEIVTAQKQLAGRGNKIAASIAEAVGKLSKSQAEDLNQILDNPAARPTISGDGAADTSADTTDYSNMSMSEIIKNGSQ